jgi:molybdopterin-biosynthesis enzyme MoeA-like protein
LINNPVSKAPGFKIGNVHVMAGIPKVMHAMLEEVGPTLQKGALVASFTIEYLGGEGDVAQPLKEIQTRYPDVTIGSYPFETPQGFATQLVLRSRNLQALNDATADVSTAAETLSKAGKARGWRRL